MSTRDHHEDSVEEMAAKLPPLKWSRETFDGLIRTLNFWKVGVLGNLRLPATKFFLDILDYYKFHISQMHHIRMVRVHHFEFVCHTMHIEPSVPRFRVFHQTHCSQGFYSFMQRASAKKILLQPPKSFHDWKQKFFFIKDVPTETIQTPFSENWCQDLKDVPSIALPEKALVGASMSLNWRMNREEKPVYMEDGKVVSLYVVAFEREGGKMASIPKKPDEELWYHRIVRNFVLLRDGELIAQPGAGAKKTCACCYYCAKKSEVEKTQSSKAKNVGGKKKGTRHSSDSWCDYVVVSDSLEGLAPAVVRRPKPEPKDTADIPPSNPDDSIDLESSPEHLLRKRAGKRKQAGVDVDGQPAKKVQKKITRRGNLDAFIAKPVLEKTVGAENPEAGTPAKVAVDAEKISSPKIVDVGAGRPQTPEFVAQDPEKGKSGQEILVTTTPSAASGFENVEKNSSGNQGSFVQSNENSPIRSDETPRDYYYRCYSETTR
ncbi:hypothetical protein Hanom_Chr14g01268041 [Helianthus anomalus]